jgi:hypothetical protein
MRNEPSLAPFRRVSIDNRGRRSRDGEQTRSDQMTPAGTRRRLHDFFSQDWRRRCVLKPGSQAQRGDPSMDVGDSPKTPRRRLGPVNVVIIVVCLVVIVLAALGWFNYTLTLAGGEPPAGRVPTDTTPEQARATSEGRSRDGSNSSQDAYTAQNQSREPRKP